MAIINKNIKISELAPALSLTENDVIPVTIHNGEKYESRKVVFTEITSYVSTAFDISSLPPQINSLSGRLDAVETAVEQSVYHDSDTTTINTTVDNTNKTMSMVINDGSITSDNLNSVAAENLSMAYAMLVEGDYSSQTSSEFADDIREIDSNINDCTVTINANSVPTTSTLTYVDADGTTKPHRVGDRRVVYNSTDSKYDVYTLVTRTSSSATWLIVTGSLDVYSEKLTINLASNQSGDTGLIGATVTVTDNTNSKTIYYGTWQGVAIQTRVEPLVNYTVSVGSVSNYTISTSSYTYTAEYQGIRSVTFNYVTCYVYFSPTSNQTSDTTVQSATATINGTAVSYGGYVRVAPSASVTIVCGSLPGYTKPSDYSGTANTSTLTPTLQYTTTVVTVNMTSTDGGDISSSRATVASGGSILDTVASGETVKVPMGATFTVTRNAVENYTTPAQYSGTASGTSMTVSGEYVSGAYLIITFASNQGSSDAILNSVTATVKNASTNATLATLSKSSNQVFITYGTNVSVTYSESTGYKTPTTVSFTMGTTNVSYTATWQTETVTLTLTGGSGTAVSCSINGTTQSISSSGGTMTVKVPFDTSYTVTCGSLSGYTAPANQSFTASQATRAVSGTYVQSQYGVYAYYPDGSISSTGTTDAIGVAVITANYSFVIGKTAPSTTMMFGGYNVELTSTGVIITNNIDIAKTDRSGYSNTRAIVDFLGAGNAPACEWCMAYSDFNGEGYCGALGEWVAVYNNKAAVDAMMSAIGGDAITTNYEQVTSQRYYYLYWSSTLHDESTFTWACKFDLIGESLIFTANGYYRYNTTVETQEYTNYFNVRAFRPL